MSIAVVADADTLFPATTRGLLIYLDYQGVIRLHWSSLILDQIARQTLPFKAGKDSADGIAVLAAQGFSAAFSVVRYIGG